MAFRFVVESTMGRLCRWLRLAGFDAAFDRGRPDPGRLAASCADPRCLVLTRTAAVAERAGPDKALLIPFDDPLEQIRFVLRQLRIRRNDLKALSRCMVCNVALVSIGKQDVRDRVPEHVYHNHNAFLTCTRCRRIYWRGTHAQRFHRMVDTWFESPTSSFSGSFPGNLSG